MKLEKVRLQNIFTHRETEFIFPSASLVALVGNSGSGKTSLLEAVPLALYGVCPSRSINQFGASTKGFSGDCSVEIILKTDSKRLKICRSWVFDNGTGSAHVFQVFQEKDGEWMKISSRKLRDSQKLLCKFFPPYEIFVVTNFSAQSGLSLLTQSEEERRKILGKFLSPTLFSQMDALFEICRKKRRDEEGLNESLKMKLSFLGEQRDNLKISPGEIERLREEESKTEERLDEVQKELKLVESEGNQLKQRIAFFQSQLRNLEKLKQSKEKEEKRLKKVEKEVASFIEEEFDESQLKILEKEKAEFERLKANYDQLRKRAEKEKVELNELEVRKAKLSSEFMNLQRNSSVLEKVPCNEDLQSQCLFVRDALEAKQVLPEKAKEFDEISIQAEGKRESLTKIEQEVSEKEAELERFEKLAERERFLLNKKREIELNKLRYQSLLKEQDLLKSRIKDLESEMKSIEVPEDFNQYFQNLEQLRSRWALLKRTEEDLNKKLGSIRRNLVKAESLREEAKKINQQIETVKKKVLISDAELEVWRILEEGFSKRGAQALLLKQELEQFQDSVQKYLDLVFSETGKNVQLFFETETQLKTKEDFKESLTIKCLVNGKEIEANQLSFGEQQGVSIALRAGLLEYNKVRNEDSLEFVLIDEPTSSTDETISLNVLEVFRELNKFFPQIIVATYDRELLRTAEIFEVKEQDGVSSISSLKNQGGL